MSRRLLTCSWKGESIISEALLAPLAAWQNYYVIVGTAAATLTGLMFVVITLAAILLPIFPGPVLFIIAAVTLLLLVQGGAVWYSEQVQTVQPSTTPMATLSMSNDARFDTDQTSTARRR